MKFQNSADHLFICFWILNQANHRFTTQMQRRIYGRATDVEIRPLNEEKAVQAAADLLGEFFVFTVLGILCFIIAKRKKCYLNMKCLNTIHSCVYNIKLQCFKFFLSMLDVILQFSE